MKIYNSLTGRKENLNPLEKDKVKIYVCGMTVYDDCHIGHARTFVCFDMVVRYLRLRNFKVDYVRNITDVDDKIINRAKENGEDPGSLTKRFIKRMNLDFNSLGMLQPDQEPRATENIKIIIDLISRLLELNYAYEVEGDVYFSINSFKDYGKLSNQKIGDIISGARIDVNTKKINPADFTLWKRTDSSLAWDSPWGKGRPGWHVECSAMSMNELGESFDIHAGGVDLKFPHHENEIAQSESITGKDLAKLWMHTGPLRINKEKMSKSLDNFLTIREAIKNHSPEVLRYFLLSSHYRSPINYSKDALEDAESAVERLYHSLLDIDETSKEISQGKHTKEFLEAMDDDFNVPEALAVVFELVKDINKKKKQGKKEEAKSLASELKFLCAPLGLLRNNPKHFLRSGLVVDDSEINSLIKKREQARDEGDFQTADNIREELLEKNIVLEDSEEGTFWRKG